MHEAYRWNIQMEHTHGTYTWNIQIEHTDRAYRWSIQMEHTDGTYRWNIQMEHAHETCVCFLWQRDAQISIDAIFRPLRKMAKNYKILTNLPLLRYI